eukprot:5722977-Amphidinium_carterae.1
MAKTSCSTGMRYKQLAAVILQQWWRAMRKVWRHRPPSEKRCLEPEPNSVAPHSNVVKTRKVLRQLKTVPVEG